MMRFRFSFTEYFPLAAASLTFRLCSLRIMENLMRNRRGILPTSADAVLDQTQRDRLSEANKPVIPTIATAPSTSGLLKTMREQDNRIHTMVFAFCDRADL